MSDHLRFAPSILARLGEELVPDADQGVIELVKNAYDADATAARVELVRTSKAGGSIRVSDDGSGMTEADLRFGFLVIGRSRKDPLTLTPRYGRVPVGDKGLGRLSALRLGHRVRVVTRPRAQPGSEFTLDLDWDVFDAADAVEDVDLTVAAGPTDRPPGTEIHIEDLRGPFSHGTANKLARSLLLLSDPFRAAEKEQPPAGDPGFLAELFALEFDDLQTKVEASYFSDADYRISADLNAEGQGQFRLLDWKGEVLHEVVAPDTYGAPPLRFDLWNFLLDASRFSTKRSTLTEVKAWLQHIGGVHIYQDGLRVPPYGGPGNDWLDMNLKRARSPEQRPSTNSAIGRVSLSNVSGLLIQKTDRVGYVENVAFQEIRRFCSDALNWAAKVRVSERDAKRRAERKEATARAEKASAALDAVLAKAVPDTRRKEVDVAITKLLQETEREAKVLREELQLYRSLATAGMTSAVFAHEIGRPLELLDSNLSALIKLIPEDRRGDAQRRLGRIETSRARLNSFVSIPLKLLAKRKRRTGRVDVNESVTALLQLMMPILDYFEIETDVELTDSTTNINGSEALIDGILLNLITNSINAFQRPSSAVEQRRLTVTTDYDADVLIAVQDNAGGIDGLNVDEIFLPGVTTSPDGTGFGLTIVQDSVADLGGKVEVAPLTPYGGALFTVRLPPMRALFG